MAEYTADAQPASVNRKFVYATYIDEPVMMVDAGGQAEVRYYYHANSLYSVGTLTDGSGAVVERYAYSAYGEPIFLDASANLLDPQASTVGNPYLFTGRRLDEETGLYYYRARMYDAALGRFVSRDPAGYGAGDMSLYQYCGTNPLVFIDPSGFAFWPFYTTFKCDGINHSCGNVTSYQTAWQYTDDTECDRIHEATMWATIAAGSSGGTALAGALGGFEAALAAAVAQGVATGLTCECKLTGRYKKYTWREWYGEYRARMSFAGPVYNFYYTGSGPVREDIYAAQWRVHYTCCGVPWWTSDWQPYTITSPGGLGLGGRAGLDELDNATRYPEWAPDDWTGWIDGSYL